MKNSQFVVLMGHPKRFEANSRVFLWLSTVWWHRALYPMPISRDLVIFVLMTTRTDYFTSCACTWGNNVKNDMLRIMYHATDLGTKDTAKVMILFRFSVIESSLLLMLWVVQLASYARVVWGIIPTKAQSTFSIVSCWLSLDCKLFFPSGKLDFYVWRTWL